MLENRFQIEGESPFHVKGFRQVTDVSTTWANKNGTQQQKSSRLN